MTATDGQENAPTSSPQAASPPSPLRLPIPRRRASNALRRQTLIVALAALTLLATVLISPILLLVVRGIFATDWQTLSEVGQSYTGISTLFSVAALMGAVLAIRLQVRQSQVALEHAQRDTQFQLLSLALQDEDLLEVVPAALPNGSDRLYKRQHVFLTMGLRHLQFLYLTKDLPASTLEGMLRSEFFTTEQAFQHWGHVRELWAAGVDNARERTFVATVERVWRTLDQSPSSSPRY